MMTRYHLVLAVLALLPSAVTAQVVISGAGPNNTDATLLAARDTYRVMLGGGTTAGANGSFGGLRREINWDGVPAAQSAPNNLAANFFNSNSPRGVVFGTPGTGFRVSGATTDAGAGQPAAANFGDINATYTATFQQFTPQRLFTSLGSTITDVDFFVPGTSTPALTRGFGAIFADIDTFGSTIISMFDASNASLGSFNAPVGNLSFLGVSFTNPIVSRVRITSGNVALGAGINDGGANDLVVMDDFLFGEPVAVPEPSSLILTSCVAFAAWRRFRRRRDVPVAVS